MLHLPMADTDLFSNRCRCRKEISGGAVAAGCHALTILHETSRWSRTTIMQQQRVGLLRRLVAFTGLLLAEIFSLDHT